MTDENNVEATPATTEEVVTTNPEAETPTEEPVALEQA